MNNNDILRILSPLAIFVIHVIYLALFSKEQFFNKWIDGSLTFFVTLVLCNIIRARVVAKAELGCQANDLGHDDNDPGRNGTS